MKALKKKDIRELNKKIASFDLCFDPKDRVERERGYYIYDNKVKLFLKEERVYPTLHNDLKLPSVFVDKGAIAFMVKGADLMVPGIESLEDFSKGDVVLICDSQYKKNLALGIALFSSDEIKKMNKGKVVRTIHYVGDDIWSFSLKK